MDKIMEILGGFDIAKLLPEVNATVGFIVLLARIVTFAVPLLILGLGLTYFLKPTPEANHTFGYRTYFGMGSVEAWKFSQKIAGLAYGGLGAILLLVMFIIVLTFFGKDLFQIANSAIICLLWQAGLALVARIAVGVMCYIYFDKEGNRKKALPKYRSPKSHQPRYRR